MKKLMFFYFEKKEVLVNILLVVALSIALISNDETTRSMALGFAAGIVLLNLGKSIGKASKKVNA